MLDGTLPNDNVPQEPVKGQRGEVGVATPALQIKQLWYATNFTMQGQKESRVRKRGSLSLKRFAHSLLTDSNKEQAALAKTWLTSKHGKNNQQRSEKNAGRIALERQATKSSRKKQKQGKATTEATK